MAYIEKKNKSNKKKSKLRSKRSREETLKQSAAAKKHQPAAKKRKITGVSWAKLHDDSKSDVTLSDTPNAADQQLPLATAQTQAKEGPPQVSVPKESAADAAQAKEAVAQSTVAKTDAAREDAARDAMDDGDDEFAEQEEQPQIRNTVSIDDVPSQNVNAHADPKAADDETDKDEDYDVQRDAAMPRQSNRKPDAPVSDDEETSDSEESSSEVQWLLSADNGVDDGGIGDDIGEDTEEDKKLMQHDANAPNDNASMAMKVDAIAPKASSMNQATAILLEREQPALGPGDMDLMKCRYEQRTETTRKLLVRCADKLKKAGDAYSKMRQVQEDMANAILNHDEGVQIHDTFYHLIREHVIPVYEVGQKTIGMDAQVESLLAKLEEMKVELAMAESAKLAAQIELKTSEGELDEAHYAAQCAKDETIVAKAKNCALEASARIAVQKENDLGAEVTKLRGEIVQLLEQKQQAASQKQGEDMKKEIAALIRKLAKVKERQKDTYGKYKALKRKLKAAGPAAIGSIAASMDVDAEDADEDDDMKAVASKPVVAAVASKPVVAAKPVAPSKKTTYVEVGRAPVASAKGVAPLNEVRMHHLVHWSAIVPLKTYAECKREGMAKGEFEISCKFDSKEYASGEREKQNDDEQTIMAHAKWCVPQFGRQLLPLHKGLDGNKTVAAARFWPPEAAGSFTPLDKKPTKKVRNGGGNNNNNRNRNSNVNANSAATNTAAKGADQFISTKFYQKHTEETPRIRTYELSRNGGNSVTPLMAEYGAQMIDFVRMITRMPWIMGMICGTMPSTKRMLDLPRFRMPPIGGVALLVFFGGRWEIGCGKTAFAQHDGFNALAVEYADRLFFRPVAADADNGLMTLFAFGCNPNALMHPNGDYLLQRRRQMFAVGLLDELPESPEKQRQKQKGAAPQKQEQEQAPPTSRMQAMMLEMTGGRHMPFKN